VTIGKGLGGGVLGCTGKRGEEHMPIVGYKGNKQELFKT